MAAVQMLAVLFHIHSIALSRAPAHRKTQIYVCTHTHTLMHRVQRAVGSKRKQIQRRQSTDVSFEVS